MNDDDDYWTDMDPWVEGRMDEGWIRQKAHAGRGVTDSCVTTKNPTGHN